MRIRPYRPPTRSNSSHRAAMRFLWSDPGTSATNLSDVIVASENQARDLGAELYDEIPPWRDLGATKTGLAWVRENTYRTVVAEPRFVSKTCDVPLFLGEGFALVVVAQRHDQPRGETFIVWNGWSRCRITDESLEYMRSDEVRENYLRRGEPATIPVEFEVIP